MSTYRSPKCAEPYLIISYPIIANWPNLQLIMYKVE